MKKEILSMSGVCLEAERDPYGLEDFQLYVCEGEMIDLIGLTGEGQAILYEYFMGYIPLKKGRVVYNGRVSQAGEYFPDLSDVACLGQGSTLIPGLSVAENICIVTGRRKTRGLVHMKNINYRTRLLLGCYAPELSPETPVRELSPMDCRIVELLRAVENEARLVVIDDVFQGYGHSDILRVKELLTVLKQQGMAILYRSHELDFSRGLADRVIVLRRGRRVRTFYEDDYDERYCQQLLLGGGELPSFERHGSPGDRVAFAVRELRGARYADGISLEFHDGEIAGLYDFNNRCNVELLRMVTGEEPAAGGGMYLEGSRYEPRGLEDAVKKGIGCLTFDRKEMNLVGSMDFTENLCLPLLKKTSRLGFLRNQTVFRYVSREYRERLGIPSEQKGTKVKYFDAYIRLGILLTRWILFRPVLMVCVEPFSHADVIMRDMIFQALDQMAVDGSAVVIASQNRNELRTVCDTIYMVDAGRSGSPEPYRVRET